MLMGIAAILAAVAWPAVAGFAAYLFKSSISTLILRLAKFKATTAGMESEFHIPFQQTEGLKNEDTQDNEKQAIAALDPINPKFENEYQAAQEYLDSTAPKDTARQLDIMKRLFAVATTERRYERIHRAIFESQQQALFKANTYAGSITLSNLKELYIRAYHANTHVFDQISFEVWLRFLTNLGLLEEMDSTSPEIMYKLTNDGHNYVSYCVEVQLPPKYI